MIQSTFYDGKREGQRIEKMEIARNLKAEGFDATQIARLTGLSLADIDAL